MIKKIKSFTAYTREDFRAWLWKNHKKENKVSVILYKRKTGKPAPTHRELMEEAICFGWIDTTVKRIDDEKYLRNFVKRTEKSKWSKNTLKYAKELKILGRMTTEGLKFYELGLKKPVHDYDVPKNPVMPVELEKLLLRNKKAKINFDKYPPSTKKMLYLWIINAKLDITKRKRIKKILEMAKEGKKAIYG